MIFLSFESESRRRLVFLTMYYIDDRIINDSYWQAEQPYSEKGDRYEKMDECFAVYCHGAFADCLRKRDRFDDSSGDNGRTGHKG